MEAANEVVQDLRVKSRREKTLTEQFTEGREFSVSLIRTGPNAEVVGVVGIMWSQGVPPFRTREDKLEGIEGKTSTKRVVNSATDNEALMAEEMAKEA